MISRVEVERFSLTSSRSFDEVLAAINDAVGHPEMAEFWNSTQQARTVGELENSIQKALGRTGLMSFVQFDHGAIVRKATGRDSPGWSAWSSVIRSSCKKWRGMFRTPALMLLSPCSSTNDLTACICRMTGWLVSWLRTGIPTRSQSRRISTRKSKPFCQKRQVEPTTVEVTECPDWMERYH